MELLGGGVRNAGAVQVFAEQWRPNDRGDDRGGGGTGDEHNCLRQQKSYRDAGNAASRWRLDLGRGGNGH